MTASGAFDGLMCSPPGDLAGSPQLPRATASYTNKDDQFRLANKAFDKQYAHTYFTRLLALRPLVLRAAESRWPDVQVSKVLQLQDGKDCILIGTVFKDMKLRYNVLDEYIKDRGLGELVGRTRFASDEDKLVLEDEAARVQLQADSALMPTGALVTGVVLAVRGVAKGDVFHVQDVCYAQLDPQPPLPTLDDDKYIALVSGLHVGNDAGNPLALSLLLDTLGGLLGAHDTQARAAKIARVVVAGNLVHTTAPLASMGVGAAVSAVRECDMLLTQMASLVPIDIMPGANDPANCSLPQQPLHRCLFPGASRFDSVERVTNPHAFEVDGVTVLGTSGQNIDDIYRYSTHEDRLEIMQLSLAWGHLVPTAPDTLTTYPFVDRDPFVVTQPPHVYFVGNQPSFASRMVTTGDGAKTLLVAVPSFSASGCVALLNLKTMEAIPMYFNTT